MRIRAHKHKWGCVCGTVGLSLNTQRPRELPRAERTASVCVLVPSKQGNLENTKGAANKHNLIPPSSYTWLWIMQRYSKDVCLFFCVTCVCACVRGWVYDAMPKPGWPDQEGCLYVAACVSYVCAWANVWHACATIHHSTVRGMPVLLGNGRSVSHHTLASLSVLPKLRQNVCPGYLA